MVNMNHLMKQAQAMQKKMAEMQEENNKKEYTGTSGGGAVTIVINGKFDIKSIKFDPSIINKDEVDILEDLVIASFNDAKTKAENSTKDSMSGMMGGMNLPPGMKMPF